MCKTHNRLALLLLLLSLMLGYQSAAHAFVRGIYLTQGSLEDTTYLNYLIKRSKEVGINTFVIDLEIPSKKYAKNITLVKESGINYIARIIVFPGGGTAEQVKSQAYWEKKYRLVQKALDYGAQEIQLDYIRYSSKQKPSSENSKDILKVVQWFKQQLSPAGIPLQVDVFGIASFGESKYIGQNLKMMAQAVDALCPMVYPSHFEPYRVHAVAPYHTIKNSLTAIHAQFDNKMPVKLYPYIELSNYRYPLTGAKRIAYIKAQIKAVHDVGADGWFAWSAHNQYDYLFTILGASSNETVEAANTVPPQQAKPAALKTTSFLNTSKIISWPLDMRFIGY